MPFKTIRLYSGQRHQSIEFKLVLTQLDNEVHDTLHTSHYVEELYVLLFVCGSN